MRMTVIPAPNMDIMNDDDREPRTDNVMKMAAITVEVAATTSTCDLAKLEPALASVSARLAIWPHLQLIERA